MADIWLYFKCLVILWIFASFWSFDLCKKLYFKLFLANLVIESIVLLANKLLQKYWNKQIQDNTVTAQTKTDVTGVTELKRTHQKHWKFNSSKIAITLKEKCYYWNVEYLLGDKWEMYSLTLLLYTRLNLYLNLLLVIGSQYSIAL